MFKITTLAAAAALTLAATGAQADEWKLVGHASDSLGAVDVSRIERDGDYRIYPYIISYLERPDAGWDYLIIRERVDCARSTIQVLSGDGYLQNGDHVATENTAGEVDNVEAGAVGETKLNYVCGEDRTSPVDEADETFASPLDFVVFVRSGEWE